METKVHSVTWGFQFRLTTRMKLKRSTGICWGWMQEESIWATESLSLPESFGGC